MRRTYTNVRSILDDIAFRKARAARARFEPTQPGVEASRDVYLASCAHLASPYIPFGFRYARSKQHLTLRSGPFTFYVGFSSSHHNVPGEHVALWIAAGVWSPHLKRWRGRQEHSLGYGEMLAGGQLGNLQESKAWLEWELASPSARTVVLADAANAIADIAVPYFALFQDVPLLLETATTLSIPELSVGNAIELCLSFDDSARAERVGSNFLQARPDLIGSFEASLAELRSSGFQRARRSGYAEELAWVTHAYGLSLSVGNA